MPFHRPILESKPPEKNSGALAGYIEAEKLMQIAFVLPAAVVIGWGIGWWADSRFHHHWIAIAGVIFGCLAGLFYVIQQAIVREKNSRKIDSSQNGTGKGSNDLES